MGLIVRTDVGVRRALIWLVICGAAAAGASTANEEPTDSRRAQTPLSEIAGAEAPPTATTAPVEEFPAVKAAYEQARAQIEDGRFQAALETLAGVSEGPGGDRYEIHHLIALAKTGLGQLDAARVSAEAAARLGHGMADVHYLLAQIYRQEGQRDSATAHYRSATLAAERELNNTNVTLAWFYLGQLLEEAGYELAAAEALAHFDTAVWQTHSEQRNAAEVAALLAEHPHGLVAERLRLLRGLKRGTEAVRTAEWAREVWPDDLYVDRMYAETLLSTGAAGPAFEFCRQRWDDPGRAAVLLPTAVEAANAAHRLDEWVDGLAREVAEGRGVAPALALTRYLNRLAMAEEALRIGRALLAQRPDDPDVVWELAAAYRATGDLRAALETLITLVRKNAERIRLPRQRLLAWAEWFEASEDLAGLAKELRARPDADFATDFVLGVSTLAADQPALADELLRSCIAARPDFAPAYVVRGEMLLATHQWDAARAEADGVLEAQPDLAAAHYVLAEAHDGLDENEQAERAYKQAIKLQPDEPAYQLALARHYRRLDNLLGAQRYFQEALENDAGNGAALEELIDCYLRDGKVEIARTQLERVDRGAMPKDALRRVDTLMRFVPAAFGAEHLAALREQSEQYPDDLVTARYLAAGLYQWGRLAEAYEVIQKARAPSPDDYHLTSLLVNVHAARDEFDQAITLLRDLAERFPNRLAVLDPLALCCVYDFRFEEGRPVLARLIELTEGAQKRSEYRKRLCDSYLIFGEFDEALRLLEGWIQKEPKDDDLLWHKAAVLIEAERHDEALETLEAWLNREPDDLERRRRFCRDAARTGRHERVADRIREWLKADPSSVELTEWLVNALLSGDRPDEAFQVARKFEEGTYAESLERRIWLGRCRAAKGETDAALTEFDELLAERAVPSGTRLAACEQIVLTLHGAGEYDRALERCDQWLKEARGRDDVLGLLALELKREVLRTVGRDRECAEVMEALLEYLPALAQMFRDPEQLYAPGLLNDLGYTWVDLGRNVERATELIRRAVSEKPWRAAFIDSLGWAYYKAGDFTNAHKHLARAARLRDGQDPVVYDHLADAAYRLGDREAADRHWRNALPLIQAALNEGDVPSPERKRLADLAEAVRAKLAALERSESPTVAPTAAEQHEE